MADTLKRRFINDVYSGDEKRYRKERKEDKSSVQFIWECYKNNLVQSGLVTQEECDKAVF